MDFGDPGDAHDADPVQCLPSLLELEVGCANHLAPLLGFFGDELSERGGRAAKRRDAQVGKAGLHLGIGKARIDLLLSFSMISTGVFLGAHTPFHPLAS